MDDLTRMSHEQMPLTRLLELEVETATPELVVGWGRWKQEHCTAGGLLHGGYLMALADSVGAMCAFYNLPEATSTATIESKTNLVRPVTGGRVRFEATPVHVGRTIIVVQTDARDDEGRLVSRTLQTQAVIGA